MVCAHARGKSVSVAFAAFLCHDYSTVYHVVPGVDGPARVCTLARGRLNTSARRGQAAGRDQEAQRTPRGRRRNTTRTCTALAGSDASSSPCCVTKSTGVGAVSAAWTQWVVRASAAVVVTAASAALAAARRVQRIGTWHLAHTLKSACPAMQSARVEVIGRGMSLPSKGPVPSCDMSH